MPYPWSAKEDEMLKVLCENGFLMKDIRKVLSRSENAISIRASKFGLSLNGLAPKIDLDEFARLMKGKTTCL